MDLDVTVGMIAMKELVSVEEDIPILSAARIMVERGAWVSVKAAEVFLQQYSRACGYWRPVVGYQNLEFKAR